jgi:SAM-dependent methyltransferase
MKQIIKKIIRIMLTPFVLADYLQFMKSDNSRRFSVRLANFYPQIKDKTVATGFDRHYIYHTAWAARKVFELKPQLHIDIGSSLYFSGIVSAFVPVKFYDYRPADLALSGLTSERADLLRLPFDNESIFCLSCMHTIEHIGLGRYGDPLDPEGDLKAIDELKRVLAPGGNLLFVVPVGKPKIMFNAHRIYSYEQIVKYFSGMELKEFSLIPEKAGDVIINAGAERVNQEEYGCGCFWFVKK